MAIRFAKADMVKLLLDKGCDVKMPPQLINTAQAADWASTYRSTPFIIQAAMRGDI